MGGIPRKRNERGENGHRKRAPVLKFIVHFLLKKKRGEAPSPIGQEKRKPSLEEAIISITLTIA